MKNLFLMLLVLSSLNSLHASDEITFSTGFIIINKARVQAIQVDIPELTDFELLFKKWMNAEYDYRLDGGKIIQNQNNVYSVLNSRFPEISNNNLDLYIQITDTENGVRLSFYISSEFDTWLNWEQHPYEFTKFAGLVKRFTYQYLSKDRNQKESDLSMAYQ